MMNDGEIIVVLEDDGEVDLSFDDRINIIQTHNHDELQNLDYESSGHTGFVPSKLSLLPQASKQTSNERLSLFVSDNGTPSHITIKEISERIIRTADEIPSDLQEGQYLFLEKKEEEIENGD